VEGKTWSYSSEDGYSGFHAERGMFAAYGFNVKKGVRVDAEIYDLAPTILFTLGLGDVAKKLDGKVLREIFQNPEVCEEEGAFEVALGEKERIRRRAEMLRLYKLKQGKS